MHDAEVSAGGKTVKVTNLEKPFWPDLGITKRDLLMWSDLLRIEGTGREVKMTFRLYDVVIKGSGLLQSSSATPGGIGSTS